jgi:hypothetical protein
MFTVLNRPFTIDLQEGHGLSQNQPIQLDIVSNAFHLRLMEPLAQASLEKKLVFLQTPHRAKELAEKV